MKKVYISNERMVDDDAIQNYPMRYMRPGDKGGIFFLSFLAA
jgi:hypothetical protein